ncbi:MAG: hypothetical protein C4288_18290 [Leptolyngbya sp. ERB_1_1]
MISLLQIEVNFQRFQLSVAIAELKQVKIAALALYSGLLDRFATIEVQKNFGRDRINCGRAVRNDRTHYR